jgi:hypothetical protein
MEIVAKLIIMPSFYGYLPESMAFFHGLCQLVYSLDFGILVATY